MGSPRGVQPPRPQYRPSSQVPSDYNQSPPGHFPPWLCPPAAASLPSALSRVQQQQAGVGMGRVGRSERSDGSRRPLMARGPAATAVAAKQAAGKVDVTAWSAPAAAGITDSAPQYSEVSLCFVETLV